MVRTTIIGQQRDELAAAANYRVRKVAALCGISVRQLQRDFHRQLGCSPQTWLNERRMQAAQRRLLAGEQVKKVAFDLGFKQVSYFCMHFKAMNRMTPTEFVLSHCPREGVSREHNRWRENATGVC